MNYDFVVISVIDLALSITNKTNQICVQKFNKYFIDTATSYQNRVLRDVYR